MGPGPMGPEPMGPGPFIWSMGPLFEAILALLFPCVALLFPVQARQPGGQRKVPKELVHIGDGQTGSQLFADYR